MEERDSVGCFRETVSVVERRAEGNSSVVKVRLLLDGREKNAKEGSTKRKDKVK